jgi:hypothetical protein
MTAFNNMATMKQHRFARIIALLPGIMMIPVILHAQPSDAQVKKDVTGAKTIAVTLTSKPGTRQWNSDLNAYEWVRGVICTLRTEHPEVKLLVEGDAVYNLIGTKATYRKFRVISNEYLGLPKPSVDAIMEIINSNRERFFGYSAWSQMVGEIERLEVVASSDSLPWIWHTFNSVELPVATRYSVIASNTTVERVDVLYWLRIYRDDMNAPWKTDTFVSTPRDRNILGRTTHTPEEIRGMQTMGQR